MIDPAPGSAQCASSGRLAVNQLAYLRSIAEGLSVVEAARRYLAIEHGAEAITAHRLVVERVAAVARRRGDPRWRLLGLAIDDGPSAAPSLALGPSLSEWAAAEGLDGWSEAELQEMYVERFGAVQAGSSRRLARNARLRAGRLALLRELERVAAVPAAPGDRVEGWLAPGLAAQLNRLGILTIADLRQKIRHGGRWWAGIRAYGPVKATRLAAYLASLIGPPENTQWTLPSADRSTLDGSRGANRASGPIGIEASNDREAIRAWIAARSGSPATTRQYEREAERFVLWMIFERGRALADATVEDCSAYLAFLADVPAHWISRRKVGRFEPGWAPFRGSLSIASRALAVAALHSLFSWLVRVRYLVLNPWEAINRKLGDDPRAELDVDPSRAFTPAAWAALQAQLAREPASPSRERLRWLLVFVEATGLRASELLAVRRSHLINRQDAWFVRIHGKGRKNRLVPIPSPALRAAREYFASRRIDFDAAPGEMPLIATLEGSPLSYSALYETFTRFVRRAVRAGALSPEERGRAEAASMHWLRHTHATRAAERDVPLDVLQANLGQADPRTTSRYYRAQIERRLLAMEKAFGKVRAP